jgi:hypothetical protein
MLENDSIIAKKHIKISLEIPSFQEVLSLGK